MLKHLNNASGLSNVIAMSISNKHKKKKEEDEASPSLPGDRWHVLSHLVFEWLPVKDVSEELKDFKLEAQTQQRGHTLYTQGLTN